MYIIANGRRTATPQSAPMGSRWPSFLLSVQACGSNQGETRRRYTSAPKRGLAPPSLPAFRFRPTCRGKTVILYQYQGYTDARKNPFSLYHCLSCCCHMLCMSAKMKQKSPFSLATAAGNRKTAKKRGAPGTHWGGGVAAPRPSWIV